MGLIQSVPIVLPNVARLDEITIRQVRQAIAAGCWTEILDNPEQRITVHLWDARARIMNRELHDVYAHILGAKPK